MFSLLVFYCSDGMEENGNKKMFSRRPANYFITPCNDTLLTFVIKYAKPWHVKILIQEGADPNVPNWLGEYPLGLTIREGDFELTEMLLKYGADPNIHKGLLLHHAISKKRLKIIDLLLQHGADLNSVDRFGYTPLCRAIYHKDVSYGLKLAEIWFKNNLNINRKDITSCLSFFK